MSARITSRIRPKYLPMVGWYDPRQLVPTGIDVAVTTLFGENSDYRLIEALESPKTVSPDIPPHTPEADFWFDYVADVGDGWNSTYAIATTVAQPELSVSDSADTRHLTRRGSLLVFGGDEVYPVASRTLYEDKLVAPYEAALRATQDPSPLVRAVPGNHDWYDSLVSFTRLFCNKDYFAGWRARQACSYFAVKLPYGWWLLGTDIQLGSDIDQAQVDYFKGVALQIDASDRIILCNAEPHWIYAQIYGASDTNYNESNLSFLEHIVFKDKRVTMFLSGDLHHYRRHARADGVQKITAGGGGAFLHPTHGPDVATLAGGFRLQSAFPSERDSRRLCWRNLLFPVWNPQFGLVTGILYGLTAWSVLADLSIYGIGQFTTAVAATVNLTLQSQIAAFWLFLLLLAFWLFTDTHSKTYRYVAGALHGLTHLFATFVIGWGVTYATVNVFHLAFRSTAQLLAAGALIVAAGAVVGSFIMGAYLLVSLNVFARHLNEAFSSLKNPDWKSFLRMKIDRAGNLTIFPIGIRRVPRKWRRADPRDGISELVGDDARATPPHLIETPIVIAK
jgi:hypothetical protein